MPRRSSLLKGRGRKIKGFGGQHETRPIKDPRMLQDFIAYFLKEKEKAKSKSAIKSYQADRNWMLVILGLNTAFRAEDLLQLRGTDVMTGYVTVKENKTGKVQNFRMHKDLHKDICDYMERNDIGEHDYLFRGQKNTERGRKYISPITRQQGHKVVSDAAEAIGIPFVFGLHSLRKTFGYMYIKNGGKPETLMRMYNHNDYNVTMRYVCWGIEDDERNLIYLGSTKSRGREK